MGFNMFGGKNIPPVPDAAETTNVPEITLSNFTSLDYTDPAVKDSFDKFLKNTKTGGLFTVITGFRNQAGFKAKAGVEIPDFPIKDAIIQVAKNLTHKYYHLLKSRLKNAVYDSIYELNGGQDLDDDDKKIKTIMDQFDSLKDDEAGFNSFLESTFANSSNEVLEPFRQKLFQFYDKNDLED